MGSEIQVRPTSPDAVREEIERTRARMSATIDEIEVTLIAKKERLREQVDVAARIRAKPLQAAGIALGAGLLLGLLTGRKSDGIDEDAAARAELWEERARRLLAIAHAQEQEIDTLEEELEHEPAELEDEGRPVRERFRALREDAAERFSSAAAETRDRLHDTRKRLRHTRKRLRRR